MRRPVCGPPNPCPPSSWRADRLPKLLSQPGCLPNPCVYVPWTSGGGWGTGSPLRRINGPRSWAAVSTESRAHRARRRCTEVEAKSKRVASTLNPKPPAAARYPATPIPGRCASHRAAERSKREGGRGRAAARCQAIKGGPAPSCGDSTAADADPCRGAPAPALAPGADGGELVASRERVSDGQSLAREVSHGKPHVGVGEGTGAERASWNQGKRLQPSWCLAGLSEAPPRRQAAV